jgi:hypothetical protein
VIHRSIPVAVALLLISVASPIAVAAPQRVGPPCKCVTAAEALLEGSDAVFIGDILAVKGAGDGMAVATIRVKESFKGAIEGVVNVRDASSDGCSWSVFEMAEPGRYIVFANRDDEDQLVTPEACPQTQPLVGWQGSLALFRAYAKAHPQPPRPARPPS